MSGYEALITGHHFDQCSTPFGVTEYIGFKAFAESFAAF